MGSTVNTAHMSGYIYWVWTILAWNGVQACKHTGPGLRLLNTDQYGSSSLFHLTEDDTNMVPTTEDGLTVAATHNIDIAVRLSTYLQNYYKEATGNYSSFDLSAALGPCAEYPYGFVADKDTALAPCFLFELNKVPDWIPTPLGEGEEPEWVRNLWWDRRDSGQNLVWMNCNGRHSVDKEAIYKIEYFPSNRGFPLKYYPYLGDEGEVYHSPLVAVRIIPEQNRMGQVIEIQCRAITKELLLQPMQFSVYFTRY